MRVKIWGARGSIPTPVRPEEVREKIVSAILNISRLAEGELREELLSAVLEEPQLTGNITDQLTDSESEQAYVEAQARRRRTVDAYLDSLSPLQTSTAGGNTPCIEVRSGPELFIIDAGSGIRELGLELMKGECGQGEGEIHLLFSHPHWDHIQGLPFFRPAFVPGNKIYIYGVHDMEAALRRQQDTPSFPVSLDYMQAEIEFIHLESEDTLNFGDLRIRNMRNHHPGDAYSFRFEKGDKVFVYASDAAYPAGIDLRPYLSFFADADVLIYDAQFTQRESDEKEDWGHSSSLVGIEMAQQANVKNLVLYHYDPTYSDKDLEEILENTLKFQQNQYPTKDPVQITIAQEGRIFDLSPSDLIELQQVPGGKAVILKPKGVFDERAAAQLNEQFLKMENEAWPPQIIIDMSEVEMLQVTGLRALVKLRRSQPGLTMALAGPTINVQQVISLTGYLDFFAIYPSVHAALKAFQARKTLNLPGQMIKNRYYIEDKIGDGRLGTVFKAVDTRLNQPVAIKVLSPSFSDGAIEQFLQQARQIVELSHPNIVSIYDCDEDRGLSFMAEEFFANRTLRDMLSENGGRPLPLSIALSIAEKIAVALEYAHAHGVIHGDLKPKNVLLADDVKISDFGLGRLESGKSLINLDVPLALVTAHYLAPEQILGHPIDGRTDLYALGVILYELLTGQHPFEGTDEEVLEHHRSSPPTPPRELNLALSHSLEHLILKLLDKDPNKRYATARQVRHILASMITTISGNAALPEFSRRQWPPLMNRTEAFQTLTALWQETQQGRGHLVLLTGEAGIGKTRLAYEFVQRAGEATVLVGNCQKLEGNRAYQPFSEALRAYFVNWSALNGGSSDVADSPVGRVLIQMVKFIPEIGEFIPDIVQTMTGTSLEATGKPNGNSPERTVVAAVSLAETVAQVTAERPWLLILDDLHRADPSSLKLLHYLARRCAEFGLMIVGTYRQSALEDSEYLTELLDTLKQEVEYSTLALDPLTEDDVRQLLRNIWSDQVPADLVAAIYRRTEGNPFYIEEIAQGLMDEGVVSWREDKWHFASVVEVGLPQRIRDAVLRRTNRLSKKVQSLLNQAAILGPSFKLADLQEMGDLSKWDMLEGLDIALERQLINQTPNEDILTFSHVEIREVLYKNLSPLKQRVMHLEAGEALERRHQPDTRQGAEQLAHHFVQAGELEKGLQYSIEAAQQADAIYAENALFWYTQALEALDQLDLNSQSQQQRFDLLLARERLYGHQGNRRAQVADLTTLRTLVETAGDPAQKAVVQNRRALYERLTGNLTEAMAAAEDGLVAARQANDPALEADSLIQTGHILAKQSQFEPDCQPCDHLHRARKLLQESGNRLGEVYCLNELASVYRHLNDYTQAEEYVQEAWRISQSVADRRGQALGLKTLGLLYLETGIYVDAITCLGQALEISRIVGDKQIETNCLNHLAATYKELGRIELARGYIDKACALRRNLDDEQGQAEDLRVQSVLYLTQGDYVNARDYAGEALALCQRLGFRIQEGRAWLELGLALEALDDLTKASAAYKQAQAISREVPNEAGDVEAQAGLARCLLAEGKTDEAQQQVEAYLTWTEQHGTVGIRYPIRLYLTAFWVLQAAKQRKKANTALRAGQALLQKRADGINDPDLRALFEEKVPENKELRTQLKLQMEKDSIA